MRFPIQLLVAAALVSVAAPGSATPHFRTPSIPFILPAGSNQYARDPGLGDVDGDGRVDLVAGSVNGLWIYRQAPGNVFAAPDHAIPGADVAVLAVAKAAGAPGNDIYVLQSLSGTNGSSLVYTVRDVGGVFTPSAQVGAAPGFFPSARVADLNGDGFPDVAVDVGDSSQVYVFFNDGAGGFGAPPLILYPGFVFSATIAVGDVNGDGKPDIVVGGSGGASPSATFLGLGGGAFSAPIPSSGAPSYLFGLGHFTASPLAQAIGTPDLAGVVLTPGAADGTFGAGSTVFTYPQAIFQGGVGDFNGDGKLDVALSGYNFGEDVQVLYGRGDGTFDVGPQVPNTLAPVGAAVADVDGDGTDDLAIGGQVTATTELYLGRHDGTFGAPVSRVTGNPSGLALADLDGDGKLDALVPDRTSGVLGVYHGNGDGSFTVGATPAAGSNAAAVATGLLDAGPRPDVLVAVSGALEVFLNDGTGGLLAPSTIAVAGNPRGITTGDLNHDGKLDVVLPSFSAASTTVLLGDGAGGFTAAPTLTAPSGSATFAAIDRFDNDADPDLAIANGTQVLVYAGHGDGTFATTPTVLPDPAVANVLTAADLDGDGHADLFAGNQTGSAVSYWHNNGAGGFDARVDIETRPVIPTLNVAVPGRVVVADFDGDGANDVLVASNARYATLLPGTTPGSLGPPIALGAGYSGRSAAVGDVDGDGDLDVVVLGGSATPGTVGTLSTLFNQLDLVAVPAGGPPRAGAALAVRSASPNPSRGAFVVRYRVASTAPVRIALVDVRGRIVESALAQPSAAGEQSFVREAGRRLPTGVYSVVVSQGMARATSRIVILR